MARIKNVMSGMPSDIGFTTAGSWGKIKIVHLGSESDEVGPLVVEFKAFIKRFSDRFDGSWSEQQYPNQSVPIAHQVRPKRSMHLEWTVPAANEAEAISNLAKCSALAQMMFPSLKKADNWAHTGQLYYPQSSFIGIKFANIIQDGYGDPLRGYVNGFNFTPNFQEGVFVTNRKKAPRAVKGIIDEDSKSGFLAPIFIDIALDFTPFYIRTDLGYQESDDEGDEGISMNWPSSFQPYGADFDAVGNTVADGKKRTKKTDLCITSAKEGGSHNACGRSARAGASSLLGG